MTVRVPTLHVYFTPFQFYNFYMSFSYQSPLPPSMFTLLSLSLKHSRNQPVRHSICVAFPVLAIFVAAAVLITYTAVHQQDGHVNNVEVW